MSFQKILLPTDLSAEGERAFQSVAALARKLGAELMVLHVVENVGSPRIGSSGSAPPQLPGTKEELERARGLLAEHEKRLFAGLRVKSESIVAPSVPHAIADFARERGCDVIALSTHGRSGFRRLIVGSVAEAVLRNSRVPVLIFPRQE